MSILLLDSHNLLMRAFSTLPRSMVDSDHRPINAIYGMLSGLQRLLRETKADGAIAAFDVPRTPTFRHRRFAAYQGQRGPLGGEHAANFEWQADLAFEVLPTIGIPTVRLPGFEADDVMGTLASRLGEARRPAVLISTDRDLLQLVRPGIEIMIPTSQLKRIAQPEDVRSVLGVDPSGVTTLKSLAGDASDNIPGVVGVGMKTAVRLVDAYGSLERLYEHLQELPPGIAAKLLAGREDAFLFRDIVTIRTDLTVPVDPNAIATITPGEIPRPRQILEAFGSV